jgi:hypothetical protein
MSEASAIDVARLRVATGAVWHGGGLDRVQIAIL